MSLLTEIVANLAELKALLAENCVLVEHENVHVHITLTLDEYRRLVGDDPPDEAWDEI